MTRWNLLTSRGAQVELTDALNLKLFVSDYITVHVRVRRQSEISSVNNHVPFQNLQYLEE